MGKVIYDDTYSYEIFDDGYVIYVHDVLAYNQKDPFGKVLIPDGSYEENAIAHIESLLIPVDPEPVPPTEEEKLRSDVDYIALIEDIDLPSKEVI